MKSPLLIALATLLFPVALWAQHGLTERPNNTELLIDSPPPTELFVEGDYQLEPIYLPVTTPFDNLIGVRNKGVMTMLAEFPDGSGRVMVVKQGGRVVVFPDKPTTLQAHEVELFMDMTDEVCYYWENGLYTILFDPDYATNGVFYITYVYNNDRCELSNPASPLRVSRFTNPNPSQPMPDLSSEEILLELHQWGNIHKAGDMRWGPEDGHLYISFGDFSNANQSQNTQNLAGTIIRIDVDSEPDPGLPYRIPTDNPFYDGGPAGTNTRQEIWAYGFRNPYRMSFDETTGHLLVGDVGSTIYEELNLVEPGKNYGWPVWEGPYCRQTNNCPNVENTLPIYGYDHFPGFVAIKGGFTWLNENRHPELAGRYVFSDTYGRLMSIHYSESLGEWIPTILNTSVGHTLSGSGPAPNGEVYFLELYNDTNHIHRLVAREDVAPPEEFEDFPWRVSDIPAFELAARGEGHLVDGVVPYRPSAQLWSDGALKERYIALPGQGRITYRETEAWGFPNKSILVKNFLVPLDDRDPEGTAVRTETRLMYRYGGDWHGFSYRWNQDETEATLLATSSTRTFQRIDKDGNPYTYDWYFPSSQDCNACHTQSAWRVLGLNSAAMNYDFTYPQSGITSNQLETFVSIGYFDGALPDEPANLDAMPDYTDPTAPLDRAARAYLAMNCAMCHMPDGPGQSMDLRWHAEDLLAIGVFPSRGDLEIDGAALIYPGWPEKSIVWARMHSGAIGERMPPIATSRVDDDAVELIWEWIAQMDPVTSAGHHWQRYE